MNAVSVVTPAEKGATRRSWLLGRVGDIFDTLRAHAAARPSVDAVVDCYETRLSYHELEREATALASALTARESVQAMSSGCRCPTEQKRP